MLGLQKLKSLTKEFVASELDMSLSSYSKIERSERDASLDKLVRIAEILRGRLLRLCGLKRRGGSTFHKTRRFVRTQQPTIGRMEIPKSGKKLFLKEAHGQ